MLVVSCYWLLLLFQWCSRAKLLALIFQRRSMTVESDWGFGLCLRYPSITCLSSQNTQTKQSMVQKILRSNVHLTVIRSCSADPMLQQVQTDAMICTNLSHDVPFITIPSHLVNYPTMLMNVSIHFPTGGPVHIYHSISAPRRFLQSSHWEPFARSKKLNWWMTCGPLLIRPKWLLGTDPEGVLFVPKFRSSKLRG